MRLVFRVENFDNHLKKDEVIKWHTFLQILFSQFAITCENRMQYLVFACPTGVERHWPIRAVSLSFWLNLNCIMYVIHFNSSTHSSNYSNLNSLSQLVYSK